MKHKLSFLAVITALYSSVGYTEDIDIKPFTGSGEAGYNNTTGNTISESIYAGLKFEHTQSSYKLKGLLEANNKTESHIRTQERYVGDLQGNLYFSDYQKAYGFGQFRLENDRFASIGLNSYLIAGLGYQFFKEKALVLSAEAGLGNQTEDYTANTTNTDFSQVIAKLTGDFEYALNPFVRFMQDVSVFTGEKQTKYETNTGIKVNLADNLNMKATYKYRSNSKPASGKQKEDTETLVTLIYDF